MRLAIVSGEDKHGLRLARQALIIGYDVTLLARSPEEVTIRHSSLTVVWGKLQDEAAIEKTLRGADAVIGVLDGVGADGVAVTDKITRHMHQLGLQRLLLTLDKEVDIAANERYESVWQRLYALFFGTSPKTVRDILTASHLEWTVLRDISPHEVKSEPTDVFIYGHSSGAGARDFMLAQLTNTTYLCKSIGLVA